MNISYPSKTLNKNWKRININKDLITLLIISVFSFGVIAKIIEKIVLLVIEKFNLVRFVPYYIPASQIKEYYPTTAILSSLAFAWFSLLFIIYCQKIIKDTDQLIEMSNN